MVMMMTIELSRNTFSHFIDNRQQKRSEQVISKMFKVRGDEMLAI